MRMPSVCSSSSMMLARAGSRLSAAWTGCADVGRDGADCDWAGWDWVGWDEADTGWEETVGLAGAGAAGFGPTRSPPVPVGPFGPAGAGRGPAAESDPAAIDLAVVCSTSSSSDSREVSA